MTLAAVDHAKELLSTSRADHERLVEANHAHHAHREGLLDTLDTLDGEQKARGLAIALGETPASADRTRELAETHVALSTADHVAEQLAARIAAAKHAIEAREADLGRALADVARPLVQAARERAYGAWLEAARQQSEWISLAEASGIPCTGSHVRRLTADRVDGIADAMLHHNIHPDTFGRADRTAPADESMLRRLT